jgi:trimethylamine--corrinoid protein Co-methyltransferase
MKMNQTINKSTRFRVLSEDQIEQIFYSALEVLERTGGNIYHEGALELFKNSNAVVRGNNVRIPTTMVEEALNFYPRKITLKGRNGQRSLHMQKDTVPDPICLSRTTARQENVAEPNTKMFRTPVAW